MVFLIVRKLVISAHIRFPCPPLHMCQGDAEGKIGSIETEAEALAACIDLHAAGPSKVLPFFCNLYKDY